MQSEEFDKKIRDAASHHHPAYDEKAWNKMEKLLDKHVPQEKKDRRRFIFFLLILLLLSGGAFLLIGKPRINKQPDTSAENKMLLTVEKDSGIKGQVKNPGYEIVLPSRQEAIETGEKEVRKTGIITPPESAGDNSKHPVHISGIKNQNDASSGIVRKNKKNKITKNAEDDISKEGEVIMPAKVEITITQTNKKLVENRESGVVGLENEKNQKEKKNSSPLDIQPIAIKQSKGEENIQSSVIDKDANALPANTEANEKITKVKTRKKNIFFVSFSLLPDVSFTSKGQPGTMKVLGGGGIGYTFNNRFTLRTGFYTGRKVYTAAPDAYDPPAIFWNYYPYLEKVNADCKVYEIPLSLSYNFGKPSSRQWFVAGGISSLIMKKEEYYYTYKYTPAGSTHYKEWTVENKNKHYFSVATISGGIQQNIGKSISLTAEPYVKIPLAGVGYGKVKLFSTGIQFTIAAKPFQPKNKTVK